MCLLLCVFVHDHRSFRRVVINRMISIYFHYLYGRVENILHGNSTVETVYYNDAVARNIVICHRLQVPRIDLRRYRIYVKSSGRAYCLVVNFGCRSKSFRSVSLKSHNKRYLYGCITFSILHVGVYTWFLTVLFYTILARVIITKLIT